MVSKDDRIYYEEELRYLAREGQRFAQRHPDIAQYLGLEELNPNLRDPHSERIIEAFAFLTGRLRRFMDQQFPELIHALFNLIFPLYLRPLPSKTLMEFQPAESMLDKPFLVPRGTALYSDPVGENNRVIEFSTTQPVLVQPISVKDVLVDPETKADFSLSVALKFHPGVKTESLQLDDLEFGLVGDPSQCFDLFHAFSQNLKAIQIKGFPLPEGQLKLVWSGFDEDHHFQETDRNEFSQLHLLRDYFDFPQRYYFFKVKGLMQALGASLKDRTDLQLNFIFHRPFPPGSQFNKGHIRLFCCPAQNVFPVLCEPIEISGHQLEYLVVPDLTRPELEVYSLEKVIASFEQTKTEVHPYYHFSFDSLSQKNRWFYTVRRDMSFESGWDSFIRLIDLDQEGPDVLRGQTLSIRALCTNRGEAQAVKIGQIRKMGASVPETISCRNISQVSKAFWPPIHSRGDWDFISHLGLNFSELTRTGPLKRLLTLYNIPQSDAGKRKITGLMEVSDAKDQRIVFGQAVHGRQLKIGLDEHFFQHEGDITLFCQVFGRFLRAYCPINSFIRLTLQNKDHSKTWEYTATY
ncbi:MAG: type VI secretion system baseplate subunit TssF [Acidobacteria bacterium]|nr:type VI secretion system baseplate subunit TssF [Acidobacteriota bacterium]MCB9398985.1 type VI secretion system baseplate subunit TssF [Acidobacteriota bacterium]